LVEHRCRGEEEEEELVIGKKTLTSLQRRRRICKRKETQTETESLKIEQASILCRRIGNRKDSERERERETEILKKIQFFVG
jgi:hypothetical protein